MTNKKPITTAVIQPLPGIGDMIWLLPALQALAAHAPDGKLTLFAKASSLANKVLADEAWVSHIVYLPKARGIAAIVPNFIKTWWALVRNRPDQIYILHQSTRYRLAAKCAGIENIFSYPQDLAKSKLYGWKKSLAFLEQLKIPVANKSSQLHIKPEKIAAARQQFATYPEPWFIVSPGSSEPERCWPVERFSTCVDALIDVSGGTVFLTGAPNEAERVHTVHGLCSDKAKTIEAAGLPFEQFMGLIACSKAVLGNDSGPINIAAALGIPAFVLCGITAPALHSPYLIIVKPDLPPEAGNGMQRISADYVTGIMLARISDSQMHKKLG
jgi:heptosyltransferase-2